MLRLIFQDVIDALAFTVALLGHLARENAAWRELQTTTAEHFLDGNMGKFSD